MKGTKQSLSKPVGTALAARQASSTTREEQIKKDLYVLTAE